MKRLVWLAIAGWLATSLQTVQAITEKGVSISVVGNEKLSALSPAFTATITSKTAMMAPVAKATTVKKTTTVSPLLSSLSALQDRSINVNTVTLVSRTSLTPEFLLSKFNPKAPTKTPPSTTKSPGSPVPVQVPDGGRTAGLLGIALVGTAAMKKKLSA